MTDDWINEAGDADAVEQVANKTGAANHRAGGNGRAVSAKANWKIQTARNATPVVSYVAGAFCRKNQW